MRFGRHLVIGRLGLAGLGLMAFVLGSYGIARAEPLLFVPHNTKFPYHLTGTGGKTVLEAVGGSKLESTQLDALLLVLGPTLFDANLKFLKTKLLTSACSNSSESETVLLTLLGHFGLARPGFAPAVLLLIPSGFEFTCGLTKVKIRGSVIGAITKPLTATASEELLLSFKQTAGKQEYTLFLLGNELLTSRFKEISVGGGAFEQAGETGEVRLLALPGQGTFLLKCP